MSEEWLPLTDAEERLLRALVETDEHFPEPSLTWLRKTLASLDSACCGHDDACPLCGKLIFCGPPRPADKLGEAMG